MQMIHACCKQEFNNLFSFSQTICGFLDVDSTPNTS